MKTEEEKTKYFKEYREKNKHKQSEYMKKYWSENKEKLTNYRINRRFGITIEEYKKMHDEQNGLCKICGQPETFRDRRTKQVVSLAIDHSHKDGKIRGLLCSRCNTTLGKCNDDINILQNMINYLNRSKK